MSHYAQIGSTHKGREEDVLMQIEERGKIVARDPRRSGLTDDMPDALQALFFKDASIRGLHEFDLVEGRISDDASGRTDEMR